MVRKNKYEVSFYKQHIKFLKIDRRLLFISSLLNKSTHFFKIPSIILISQQKNYVIFFNAS